MLGLLVLLPHHVSIHLQLNTPLLQSVARPAVTRHPAVVAAAKQPRRRRGPRPPQSQINQRALVCAACGVESSSEVSFADHIYGTAHIKRAGWAGFAGLVPNAAGVIVELDDPHLRAQAAAYERGERSTEALGTCAAEVIAKQPTMSLDYLSLASLDDGRELTDDLHPTLNGAGVLASIAVKLGGTRLIDNVVLPA